MGFGLFPQAGVAIGLALVVRKELPGFMVMGGVGLGELVVTMILAITVIFESIGPLLTEFAVTRAKEARSA